jgi:hypothetical protein
VERCSSPLAAAVAVFNARRSANAADESAGLAREEVEMMREEHQVWLNRTNARADLHLTLKIVGADDQGVLWTEGSSAFVRVEVGTSNDGERAAGRTTFNVLAPRGTRYLRWCGPGGEELADVRPPAQTSEALTYPDGRVVESDCLYATLPEVGLRTPEVRFLSFSVNFPEPVEAGAEVVVPIRAKASADELPEDVEEVVLDHLACIRRGSPAARP